MFYYYNREKLEQGRLLCVYQSRHELTELEIREINKGQNNLLYGTIVYEGELPFDGYPIIENGVLRKAYDSELVEMGYIKIEEGQYLDGNNLVTVPKPNWQYKWDIHTRQWVADDTKLLMGQYIDNNSIIEIEYDESLGYISPKWDKDLKQWIEGATELEKVEYNLKEVEKLNNHIDCEDMKTLGLYDEFVEYRKQLRLYTMKQQVALLIVPVASDELLKHFEFMGLNIK